MTVSMRAANRQDAASVADVALSSRKAFLPYAPLAHTDAAVKAWVRELLIPSGGVIVACDGDVVVGMMATAQEPSVSWVHQLYITPTHVGQGIGSRLLAHALTILASPVRLYTFQANQRANAFYERHGFKAMAFSDGSLNEERCPDVLYEWSRDT